MIFARRFFWGTANPYEITQLLDGFVAHPEFLTHPYSPEEARVIAAGVLTDQANLIWTTYSDTNLTGIVTLTRVVPKVDALLHFVFLDSDLVSKRTLLRNLITHCFEDLGFRRLTMEFPDKVAVLKSHRKVVLGTKMERFARRALGFRLEGENRQRNPELVDAITSDWVARQGSRTEQAYFDGISWFDIVRLRLLATEHGVVDGEEGGSCRTQPFSQAHQSQAHSSAKPSEAEAPKTPKPPHPKTSNPSDSKT